MNKKLSLSDVLELSVDERIRLVEDIWDSIAVVPESLPLTEAQKTELDRRLDELENSSTPGLSWQELLTQFRRPA